MNLFAIHAGAMAQFQQILGTDCPVFVWNGQQYQMIPNSANTKKPLGYGGFAVNADLHFRALVAQFGQTAVDLKNALLDTTFIYLGETYNITGVDIHQTGLEISVDADALNENA